MYIYTSCVLLQKDNKALAEKSCVTVGHMSLLSECSQMKGTNGPCKCDGDLWRLFCHGEKYAAEIMGGWYWIEEAPWERTRFP